MGNETGSREAVFSASLPRKRSNDGRNNIESVSNDKTEPKRTLQPTRKSPSLARGAFSGGGTWARRPRSRTRS